METITSFKRIFFIALASLLIVNCQNERTNSDEKQSPREESNKTNSTTAKTLTLPFIAVVDSTSNLIALEENPQKSSIPLNKEELAEALNIKYPEIKLNLREVSHDTLFVVIPNATFLTQQIGTTGALTYLAEATYAFTDLTDIKVVNFEFKEGDHAVPGPYTRKSFNTKNI